jgi:predicted GH43/DUF377 family glycosyl hydrolase
MLDVTRIPIRLTPDPRRVVIRFFRPGDDQRIRGIINRALRLSGQDIERIGSDLRGKFRGKHREIVDAVQEHYEAVKRFIPDEDKLTDQHKLLIGAYFTMEYAVESAALFNPSMVPTPDQSGLAPGSLRFIVSLRATGEGHISSIVFRRGVIDANCNITIDSPIPYCERLKVVENRQFIKSNVRPRLVEMGAYNEEAETILSELEEEFTLDELNEVITRIRNGLDTPGALHETANNILSLARANYELDLPPGVNPSEVVIFPYSEIESHGLEDVRLVHFRDDDGSTYYYGTYTAYNGFHIMPQLLEFVEGKSIRVHTIGGRYARGKGMALFPRKVNDVYMMIGRIDNENLYLMKSDSVLFWDNAQLIQQPRFPWELIQIGNCGSPLETEAGWLLLTHGVGPMREYCIGATLLDRNDPSKVIGQTREPLIIPVAEERSGYVPNVVYSCGGLIHRDRLVIPYAMSDISSSFAHVSLTDLLAALQKG